MRFIQKSAEPPDSIREWRQVQERVGVNLDYDSFTRKPQLHTELVNEQFGLCPYTGAPVDDRLGGYQGKVANLSFQPHISTLSPVAYAERRWRLAAACTVARYAKIWITIISWPRWRSEETSRRHNRRSSPLRGPPAME